MKESFVFKPNEQLAKVLPRILADLGITADDYHIVTPGAIDLRYLRDKQLKDEYLGYGGADFPSAPILSGNPREFGWNKPQVQGYVVWRFDDVKYATYCCHYGTGYDQTYIIVQKGKLWRLALHAKRNQKQLNKEPYPPILEGDMLQDVIDSTIGFLLNKDEIETYGTKIKRGVILSGKPGNGKTMICRWIKDLCNEHDIEYETVTAEEIAKTFSQGDSLSQLFDQATVVFFDDIDIGYLNRQGDGKIACALLSAMDGMAKNNHSVRIFTTNESLSDMDPAFVRPGRIDQTYVFNPPTRELRRRVVEELWPEEIVEYLKDNNLLDRLMGDTEGWSFADLEGLKAALVTNKVVTLKRWDLDRAMADILGHKTNCSTSREKIIFCGS